MLSRKSTGIKSSAVRELLKFAKDAEFISLAGGIPATDLIDIEGIDVSIQKITSGEHRHVFQYSVTEGEENLRSEIANWNKSFQFETSADNIIITNGSQQAIDLLNRVFLEKGDTVLVERPTYLAALQLFGYTDATVAEMSYQDGKIDLAALEQTLAAGGIKMLYLTPCFANPTGTSISEADRTTIVKLTHQYKVVVIEDDPYDHLRFSGESIKPLYTIAQELYGSDHHVCYMSSFSKIFSPGLRLGWIAIPQPFLMAVVVAKQALDLHTSTLNQHIAAHYLQSGRLNTRLTLLKATYKERRDLLIAALDEHLGDAITYNRPEGGMFLWCHLADDVNAAELLNYCVEEKVVFVPGEVFFAQDPERNSLRLSYSMLSASNAGKAAQRIARALARYRQDLLSK